MSDAGTTARTTVAGFPEGAKGISPPAEPGGRHGFLSDVIIELGLVDQEAVERAVDEARQCGRRVDRILLDNGDLTEDELSRAIAERYGVDHVDLEQFEVHLGAAALISPSVALRYRALPIAFAHDGALIVAVADPVDTLAISDLEVITKSEVRTVAANGSAIKAAIHSLPDVGELQPSTTKSQPPPPASASKASTDPPPPDENAAVPTLQARIAGLEGAIEDGRARRQELEQALERSEGSERARADADRRREEIEERNVALEVELAELRDRLKKHADEEQTDRRRLREQLTETSSEREHLRTEVERLSAELATAHEGAARSGSLVAEATGRIRELEDADRRAEAARLALAELRQESDREREQSVRLERQLREQLVAAEERSAAFERRLAGVVAASAEAKAAAQRLAALHSALSGEVASTGTNANADGVPIEAGADPVTAVADPQWLAISARSGASGRRQDNGADGDDDSPR